MPVKGPATGDRLDHFINHPKSSLRSHHVSLQGDIILRVPPDIAVNKYLGFMPMNPWESAMHHANPKYLFTGCYASRYHLEEMHGAGYSMKKGSAHLPRSLVVQKL